MNKLTKREKILVIGAAYLIFIVISINLLIIPAFASWNTLSEEYDNLSFEKKLTEQKIANEPITMQNFANAKEKYTLVENIFIDVITNEELDKMLTDMCMANNLKPLLLEMSIIEKKTEPKPEIIDDDDIKKNVDDYMDPYLNPEVEEEEKKEVPIIISATASIELTGEYESVKRFMGEVNKRSYMRIISMNYQFENDIIQEPVTQITIEIFMKDINRIYGAF